MRGCLESAEPERTAQFREAFGFDPDPRSETAVLALRHIQNRINALVWEHYSALGLLAGSAEEHQSNLEEHKQGYDLQPILSAWFKNVVQTWDAVQTTIRIARDCGYDLSTDVGVHIPAYIKSKS